MSAAGRAFFWIVAEVVFALRKDKPIESPSGSACSNQGRGLSSYSNSRQAGFFSDHSRRDCVVFLESFLMGKPTANALASRSYAMTLV
ncbi:MAG: hypothetical protein N2C14_33180, partial [Planctomycetales bacterium]